MCAGRRHYRENAGADVVSGYAILPYCLERPSMMIAPICRLLSRDARNGSPARQDDLPVSGTV